MSRNTNATVLLLLAGAAFPTAAAAAPAFTPLGLDTGMIELRPIGVEGAGDNIYVPYKAIKEQGVQVYESAGIWNNGAFFSAPQPIGPGGQYQDIVNYQFRSSPQQRSTARAQTIPGVDVIIRKTPGGQAALWDTRASDEGELIDLHTPAGFQSWSTTTSMDAAVIGGALYGDLDGMGVSRHAALWIGLGPAQLLPVPAGYRASEVFDVSRNGAIALGAITEQGMPSDQPKLKPANGQKGILWEVGGGGFTVVDHTAAGPDAESLALTGLSGNAEKAMATISTTRSNTKGGLYTISDGTFDVLDGGDVNSDGVIDLFDDHNSDLLALSFDAALAGGSITLPGGEPSAALWVRNSGGYTYHDAAQFFASLGTTGLDDWTLHEVTGISADGTVIVGWGADGMGRTGGWMVSVPTPSSLPLFTLGGALLASRRRTIRNDR